MKRVPHSVWYPFFMRALQRGDVERRIGSVQVGGVAACGASDVLFFGERAGGACELESGIVAGKSCFAAAGLSRPRLAECRVASIVSISAAGDGVGS